MKDPANKPVAPGAGAQPCWSRIGQLAAGIEPGSRGAHVVALQSLLGLKADGIYGPATERALKASFVAAIFEEAQASQAGTHVPAALTTAQAILESSYGRKVPTDMHHGTYSYNLFGIKETRPSLAVMCLTHEVVNGVSEPRTCQFAAYTSFKESLDAHASFLIENHRYRGLFGSQDPKVWAEELHRLGYATDPDYGPKLIALMEEWKLA